MSDAGRAEQMRAEQWLLDKGVDDEETYAAGLKLTCTSEILAAFAEAERERALEEAANKAQNYNGCPCNECKRCSRSIAAAIHGLRREKGRG